MIVTLEEMKQYLRVDFDDDDFLIETLITSATRLCMDITRQNEDVFEESENAKPAGNGADEAQLRRDWRVPDRNREIL